MKRPPRLAFVSILLLVAVSADGGGWMDELREIADAADEASAWADSTRQRARVALALRDSTIVWAAHVIAWEGAAADEARGRAMEFFKRTYSANERAVEAWGRAARAWRRALDGRNEYSESPTLAWRLRDPGAVIAFEIHGRAREARNRAAAHHARASEAESVAFAVLKLAGYIPPTLEGATVTEPGRWSR